MDCWEVGARWRKWVRLSMSLDLYRMYGSLHGPSLPLSPNQLLLTVMICRIKTRDDSLKCLWPWVHLHHWVFSGTFEMVTRNWIIHLMRCWLDWLIYYWWQTSNNFIRIIINRVNNKPMWNIIIKLSKQEDTKMHQYNHSWNKCCWGRLPE